MNILILLFSLISLETKAALNDQEEKAKQMGVAMQRGSLEQIENLLKQGANPDSMIMDGNKDLPLCMAILLDKSDIVKLLLEHNANVCAQDRLGMKPFVYAFLGQNKEVLSLLISHGYLINADEMNKIQNMANGEMIPETVQFIEDQKKSLRALNFEFTA